MLKKLPKVNIYPIIRTIKMMAADSKEKVYSNIYTLSTDSDSDDMINCIQGMDTIVFWEKDTWDISRVYFVSCNLAELSKLLAKVPSGMILDYNIKGINTLKEYFTDGGFTLIASYARKGVCLNEDNYEYQSVFGDVLDKYYDESIVGYAVESDADEIMCIMDNVFDRETDHLPIKEDLLKWIEKKWVLLYREKGNIFSIYIYQIYGKKFYSAFSYNAVTADKLYSLEKKGYMDARENYDLIYRYTWINQKNTKALKRTVLEDDGLINYIYKKEVKTEE